jgi:V/A-type H+-transporting ATPase subunit E
MAEQLQGLLERIQKDGIEKADAESQRLITEAKAQAATIISDAEARAKAELENAAREGEAFAERGKVALRQAARDIVITVGDAITNAFRQIVQSETQAALEGEALSELIGQIVESYAKTDAGTKRIDVLLPEADQKRVRDHFASRFSAALSNGVTIRGDSSLVSGFRVSLADGKIEHDFSGAAITDALCELLRPHIAQIVREATANN